MVTAKEYKEATDQLEKKLFGEDILEKRKEWSHKLKDGKITLQDVECITKIHPINHPFFLRFGNDLLIKRSNNPKS